MRCIRCHRPMKHATATGLGPKCGKAAKPLQDVEPDLLGYEIDAAVSVASERLRIHIEVLTVDALMAVRDGFKAARRRAGVWAA